MVEAHLLAWNEAEIIRFVLSHYRQFCAKIVVHDGYSDDGTPDIARDMGAEVRQFGKPGEFCDRTNRDLKNACWRRSKADWCIVGDCDEILYYPDMVMVMEEARRRGHTIFPTKGWDVFSHQMPQASLLELSTGFHNGNYSKRIIFNPQAITDMRYTYGGHEARPMGNVSWSPVDFIVLHYRNIGGPDRLIQRHALYRPRLSEINRSYGMGYHYNFDDQKRVKEWYMHYDESVELLLPGGSFSDAAIDRLQKPG